MAMKRLETEDGNVDTRNGGENGVVAVAVATGDRSPKALSEMYGKLGSYGKVGAAVGLSGERVRQIVKKHEAAAAEVAAFKGAEVDINAGIRKEILASMTQQQIRDTKSIRDRAVTYGILVDKARLLSGESTENINLRSWTAVVAASKKQLDAAASSGINDSAYLARCRERARELGPEAEAAQAEWERAERKRMAVGAKGGAE